MFEVYVRIAAFVYKISSLGRDGRPGVAGVVGFAEAEIAEIGREDLRDLELLGFGKAKSDIVAGEDFIGWIGQPGGMAEFESEPAIARKQRQIGFQTRRVAFESGGELKQNRTETAGGAQRFESFRKTSVNSRHPSAS